MRLQDQLDQRKAHFESSAPADILKVMHGATQDLTNSDILSQALNSGDQAPLFSLPDANGQDVSLKDLNKNGPVVINFFRGGW